MITKAPAKINLGLKVNFRRSDGYHDIESVMQQIGLSDYLVLGENRNNTDIEIACKGLDIPLHGNLVYKAAKELQQRYEVTAGVKIVLYKNIPVAAGLAGGSTDAAAALLSLNKLWRLDLSLSELLKIGESLGADVPFCLLGGIAMTRGKGEIINPLPRLPFLGLVLAKPAGLSLSTGAVYEKYSRKMHDKIFSYDPLIRLIEEGNKEAILNWIGQQENLNMLEKVVLEDHLAVVRLKEAFLNLGLSPVMSGSGPSVFSLTPGLKTAREVAFRLEQEGYEAWASWIS